MKDEENVYMKKSFTILGLTFSVSVNKIGEPQSQEKMKYNLWNELKFNRQTKAGFLAEIDNNFEDIECIVKPRDNLKIAFENSKLRLPLDNGVGLKTLVMGEYDFKAISFISDIICTHLKNNPPMIIDLGANCGLWSRQLLIDLANKTNGDLAAKVSLIAYEADPAIAKMAEYNLSAFSNVATVYAEGVSIDGGEKTFYFDKNHPSSSSLIPLEEANYDVSQMTISTVSIRDFQKHCFDKCEGRPFVYKSDIEGLDLPLFIRLDDAFHQNIFLSILEMRLDGLDDAEIKRLEEIVRDYKHIYVWNRVDEFIEVDKKSFSIGIERYEGWDLLLSR